MQLTIYKRNQGRYTRSLTAVGLLLVLAAISYYLYTMLVNYVPTDEVMKGKAVANVDETWVLAEPWPNKDQPRYNAGTAVSKEVKDAMQKESTERFSFRSAHPFPLATVLQQGLPALLFLLGGLGTLWLCNWPRFADFMIATEGEMKKVSWSTKGELIGSTFVVIVTVIFLAIVILCADFLWIGGLKLVHALPGG